MSLILFYVQEQYATIQYELSFNNKYQWDDADDWP